MAWQSIDVLCSHLWFFWLYGAIQFYFTYLIAISFLALYTTEYANGS